MPFKSTVRIPSEVLDAIASLTELTSAFAAQSVMEAGRHGEPPRAELVTGTGAAPLAAVRP
jgi:hypothetical protein